MVKSGVTKGMDIVRDKVPNSPCKSCFHGKQMHNPIPKWSDVENTRILDHVFSDICRPTKNKTNSGSHRSHQYFIMFIDGHSHYTTVQLMKTKDEA
ncbi:hypothetical protein IEO21_10013 [Rhodonia placenta]|uniref:Uncharacterized protein n=1 Tax=Rhodonia placenta TaxID=104341 RepID=A0A8H7TXD2_9APHY|nr:hypothetical protein IEO21_10013 [Postia placenta]